MILTESCLGSHSLQAQIFRKMIVNIICNQDKLLHIFLLPAVCSVFFLLSRYSMCIYTLSSNACKNLKEFRNNHSFQIGRLTEIFLFDFQHKRFYFFINLRIPLRCNQSSRGYNHSKQVQLLGRNIVQTRLKNNPLSAFRSKKLMKHTRTDNQHIPLTQIVFLSTAQCLIAIYDWHKYLEGGMPVRWVILVFIIIIETNLLILPEIYCFMYSTKLMYHFPMLLPCIFLL